MNIRTNTQLILDGKLINTWEEMIFAYRKRIKKYGFNHEVLFYPDKNLRTTKLNQISKIIDKEVIEEDSLLDVGCGTGDLIKYLPTCYYRGIDIVPEFIREASIRYPDFQFDCLNIIDLKTTYTWVVLFGMMGSVPIPEKLIECAWNIATKGVIVDFIDTRKYNGCLNSFQIENCIEVFFHMGAQQVKLLCPPGCVWTYFIAYKNCIFD
jgi:SAM-dependent methyltransferase